MKGIILDFDELTDSSEIYDAKPHPFFTWFIMLIALALVAGVVWMGCSTIETTATVNGTIMLDNDTYVEMAVANGIITSYHVEDNQYVEEGQLLYIVKNADMSESYIYAPINGNVIFYTDIYGDSSITAGQKIFQIISGDVDGYYVEAYVDSYNVAGIDSGMAVNVDLSAYAADEKNGIVTGEVTAVSMLPKVYDEYGYGYYLVRIRLDLDGAQSDNMDIREGTVCQGRIVTEEVNVLRFVLEKIFN